MEPEDAGRTPLILVVEDFDDAREMYEEYLSFAGFRVATAADGQQAIERAAELVPDLVLMDLSLPVVDGWEATRRIKADPRTRHIPVIALTGHVLKDHTDRAREVGCETLMSKPCLPQDLLRQIRQTLGRAGSSGAGPPQVRG